MGPRSEAQLQILTPEPSSAASPGTSPMKASRWLGPSDCEKPRWRVRMFRELGGHVNLQPASLFFFVRSRQRFGPGASHLRAWIYRRSSWQTFQGDGDDRLEPSDDLPRGQRLVLRLDGEACPFGRSRRARCIWRSRA